jgi:hypothetical protein
MSSGANTPAGEPASSSSSSSSEDDEGDAPILGLERFAALSADIESGAARDEVIAREGLSIEAWTRAQESWLGKMADEASRKRFDLTNRYNAAFVAQRRSEGGVRRAGKKKGARVEPASAGFVAAAPAFVAPAPSFVAPPSFIASAPPYVEAPSPFAAPAPSYVEAPTPFAAPPPYIEEPTPFAAPGLHFARALPFAPAPAVAMPPVVAPSAVAFHTAPAPIAAPPTNLAGTVATEMISPFASGASLPFKQGPAAPPGPPPPPKNPPPRPFRSHTAAGVIPLYPASGTPFEASADKRASPSSPPTAPLPPIQALPRPAFDPNAPMDLSGTVVASSSIPRDDAGKLPFRAPTDAGPRLPPPAPPPPPRAGQGLPFRASPPPLPPRAAPAAAPAPAAAAATSTSTRFSLEQFASLSAEIAVTPAAVAQVRGRYGLDDASHRAEAEEWGRRFSADKELFARYGALFQSYRDWLARSPR